jgi:hypothetical protein
MAAKPAPIAPPAFAQGTSLNKVNKRSMFVLFIMIKKSRCIATSYERQAASRKRLEACG